MTNKERLQTIFNGEVFESYKIMLDEYHLINNKITNS